MGFLPSSLNTILLLTKWTVGHNSIGLIYISLYCQRHGSKWDSPVCGTPQHDLLL